MDPIPHMTSTINIISRKTLNFHLLIESRVKISGKQYIYGTKCCIKYIFYSSQTDKILIAHCRALIIRTQILFILKCLEN